MEENSDYQHFIVSVNQELARSGWEVSEKFSDLGDVAMYRTDSIALVSTHRFIVVKHGDGLSKDDIVSLVTKAHRRLEGTPPLFPSTCTIVFVFTGSTPMDWVVQRTRAGNFFSSTFVVSWAVVLSENKLVIHKGAPVFRNGVSEVRSAIAAQKKFGTM